LSSITALGGADVISVSSGDAVIDAGSGSNTIKVFGGDASITVSNAGLNLIEVSGDALIMADAGADTILISGVATVSAGEGANRVSVNGVGAASLTSIVSGAGTDSITMASGDSLVDSGAGADTVTTGNGNDSVNAGAGADRITLGSGDDTLIISASSDHAAGETVSFGAGDDRILFTNSSSDTLTLLSGVSDTDGILTVELDGSADLNISASALTGGLRVNILGNSGANLLIGSSYADSISGGGGLDTITGGGGSDTLTGGANVDTFVFGTNGSVAGTALDVITDYAAGGDVDILDFAGAAVLLGADGSPLVATSNVNTTAGGLIIFHGDDDNYAEKVRAIQADSQLDAAHSVAFFEDSGNTYVYYAGAATGNTDDQIIQLTGITNLATITVNGSGDILIA
jgi:Ca2+-binding RTX toxin-like protein